MFKCWFDCMHRDFYQIKTIRRISDLWNNHEVLKWEYILNNAKGPTEVKLSNGDYFLL